MIYYHIRPEKKTHVCDVCGKLGTNKIHMKCLTKQRELQGQILRCEQCDFTTYSQFSLRHHVETHKAETHMCDQEIIFIKYLLLFDNALSCGDDTIHMSHVQILPRCICSMLFHILGGILYTAHGAQIPLPPYFFFFLFFKLLFRILGGIQYTAHGAQITPPPYLSFLFFLVFMLILG